ncbi:hypothetical protein V6N00_13745 [Tersicoccus sp. MR15.9]|uniref:hypothetical protein n=1 Tax=Tersicoccus mangrovi TaxID=3121635 RepID=UPI002FE65B67
MSTNTPARHAAGASDGTAHIGGRFRETSHSEPNLSLIEDQFMHGIAPEDFVEDGTLHGIAWAAVHEHEDGSTTVMAFLPADHPWARIGATLPTGLHAKFDDATGHRVEQPAYFRNQRLTPLQQRAERLTALAAGVPGESTPVTVEPGTALDHVTSHGNALLRQAQIQSLLREDSKAQTADALALTHRRFPTATQLHVAAHLSGDGGPEFAATRVLDADGNDLTGGDPSWADEPNDNPALPTVADHLRESHSFITTMVDLDRDGRETILPIDLLADPAKYAHRFRAV